MRPDALPVYGTVMNKPRLSILVATRNRPVKLAACLASIVAAARQALANDDWELIVVDQSTNEDSRDVCQLVARHVQCHRQSGCGISRARNLAISKSRGELLAFTDDDCLVAPDWVELVLQEFGEHPEIKALFGRVDAANHATRPFQQLSYTDAFGTAYYAEADDGSQCQALHAAPQSRIVRSMCLPHANLGSSNNMAWRRASLVSQGSFWELFGAGAWGYSAEDTELIHRVLRAGFPCLYSPNVRVVHDNWQAPAAAARQIDRYLCGLAGVYIYYALRGDHDAQKYLCYVLNLGWRAWRGGWWRAVRRLAFIGRGFLFGTVLFLTRRLPPAGSGEQDSRVPYLARCPPRPDA